MLLSLRKPKYMPFNMAVFRRCIADLTSFVSMSCVKELQYAIIYITIDDLRHNPYEPEGSQSAPN